MRWWNVFVLCLLQPTSATYKTTEQTSNITMFSGIRDNWMGVDQDDGFSPRSLSRKTRKTGTGRLDQLAQIFKTLDVISKMPFENMTLEFLVIIYDMFANVSTTSLPVGDIEANLTSEFLRQTASVIVNIYSFYPEQEYLDFQYPPSLVKLFTAIESMGFLSETDVSMDYKGTLIFAEGNLIVRHMCIVTQETQVALVVFPADSSPLRPPPKAGVRVVGFHVVHLVLVRDSGFPTAANFTNTCTTRNFFRMIVLSVLSRSDLQNLRYGCAQWSDAIKDWSSEGCLAVKEFYAPEEGQCNCDTTFNGETTEYVVYEFLEDVAEFVKLESLALGVNNASDIVEMNESLFKLNTTRSPFSPTTLDGLISDLLFKAMQFDSTLLVNNCSKTILDDIRQIMEGVEPSDGTGAIGRGNQLLKSFVFDLDVYKGDPLLAFAFHNSTERRLDMEYFRFEEQVDYNRLFFWQMEYSFIFSKSVILQNSRYGFILYPLNKFFKPLTVIDGVKVVASRVLDLFMVSREGHIKEQDQFVHMYLNPDPQAQFEYGCAYWSVSLSDWTTNGCYQNPDIYREVCTCNMTTHFNESRTRGTFASLNFRPSIDVSRDLYENIYGTFDFLIVPYFLFTLRSIDKFYYGEATGKMALNLLNQVQNTFFYGGGRLYSQAEIEFLQTAGQALVGGVDLDIIDKSLTEDRGCSRFHAVVGSTDYPHTDVDKDFFCRGDIRASYAAPSLTIRISNSLKFNNAKYAVLIHPVNLKVRQLPSIGQRIVRSYAIDVILVPGNFTEDKVDQFLEITISQTEFNASLLGCSYWRDEVAAWTLDGCRVVEVESEQTCNCSISSNFNQSRTYGQYIVYDSTATVFDMNMYKDFLLGPIDSGSDSGFENGRDLIYNLTQIPFDNDSVSRLLRIYLRLLSFDNALFMRRQNEVEKIMQDLELLIGKYKLDMLKTLTMQFSVYGTQGVNLKNADIAADIFSNAVLSATDSSNASKTVDMSAVVLGFYDLFKYNEAQGFYLVGDITEQLMLLNTFDEVALLPNTSLACFITPFNAFLCNRFVFIVYPVNTSPYPLTMTPSAIFNLRQLDLYIGFDISFGKQISAKGDFSLIISFRPTMNPKVYVKVSCASWNSGKNSWDLCLYQPTYQTANITFFACICNLTGRAVTRIIMYEYTDYPNFTFNPKLEGPSIVYLIGALLSVFGLGVLFITAILFSKWREELGNKIMINLTASAAFYLILSIYRETHIIYAASNYSSVGMIVFTACVHYSRLAHYCWGLVMSVLQYKRFSGVVGASTVSHLLLKISLFGWGAPLLPLIVLLSWNQKVHFCSPDKLTHYVLYLVPVIVITVLNIGLLVAIVLTITNGCGIWDDDELQRHGVDNKEVMLRRIKQTVLMFFLFGIPAVFEMFNDFGDHVVALEYINKILDPIQGFVMFLFFVVIDDKTRGYWHARIFGEEAQLATKVTKKVPMKLQAYKVRRRVYRPPVEEVEMKDMTGVGVSCESDVTNN